MVDNAPAHIAQRRIPRMRRPHLSRARALLVLAGVSLLSACAVLHGFARQQDRRYASVAPGIYAIDPRHCSVIFSVDHLGFSQFTMRFDRVSGRLVWPPEGIAHARVLARVDTASIDTNDAALDAELRGPSMLDSARRAHIDWNASGWRPTGRDRGDLPGVLTLGRSRAPLVLRVRFNGYGIDAVTGAPTLGFSARGTFSRAQLGLRAWPGFIGDTVHVRIEAEFVRARGSTVPGTSFRQGP